MKPKVCSTRARSYSLSRRPCRLFSALIAVSRVVLGVHYPGDTFAGALIWSPMGHYPNSFGDFEYSQNPVTRLAVHYTHSTEDRQSQPGTEDIQNTQLRLSDGTVLFTPGAFATAATSVTGIGRFFTSIPVSSPAIASPKIVPVVMPRPL